MNKIQLEKMRHSASHVLASAVLEMFPEARLGVGPAIDNGFFYDFQLPRPLIPEDLPILQKKMESISAAKLKFEHYDQPAKEALKFLEKINQPFKIELAKDLITKGEDKLSFYRTGHDFVDLCAGPHVEHTGQIGAFKLTHFSGVYWKGKADNPSLTRIYGLAFENAKELRLYEKMLEEAKKRDHREIGKKMDLFSFHEEGAGFPFWHANGMILRNQLIEYWREEHEKAGYSEISTPIILHEKLWHQSGHWDHYKENMYFTKIDEQDFAVKPMNCPGGMLVYKEKQHSYRELPIRAGELGLVHRHELSGVLHGLFRVRSFTQDDAHIFCTEDQMEAELLSVVELIDKIYSKFNLTFHIELSTRPAKSIGSDKMWELAENTLKNVLKKSQRAYEINEGDGAFYGPKLDFHIKDCIGRTWQCATVQLDFSMPERFDLEYIGEDGNKHRPVMLHRVIFGALERFIGILIEHTAGLLPLWLAPTQAIILPVADIYEKYAQNLIEKLSAKKVRATIKNADQSLGKRIREAEIQRIPLIIIIGEKETQENNITIRQPGKKEQNTIKSDEFITKISQAIEDKTDFT